MNTDSPAEALRRRSKALIVIVGYPESGWSVTARREPSEPLLSASGHTIDAACAELLAKLMSGGSDDMSGGSDIKPPKLKLKLKPQQR